MAEIEEKTTAARVGKKRRIYQVAKEFHVSIESIVEFLQGLGYEVKNQMSQVSEEMYEKIVERFGRQKGGEEILTEDDEIRRKILERERKEQERLELIRREIEELAETKPLSLEEVQRKTEEEAKERRERERKEKERLEKERRAAEKARKEEEEKLRRKREEEEKRKKEEEAKRRLTRLLDISAGVEEEVEVEVEAPETTEETAEPVSAETPEEEGKVAELEMAETVSEPAEPQVEEHPEVVASEEPAEAAMVAEEEEAEKEALQVEEELPPETEALVEEIEEELIEEEEELKKGKKPGKAKAKEEAEAEEAVEKVAEKKKKKKKKEKKKKKKFTEEEVEAAIKRTMAAMEGPGRAKRRKRAGRQEEVEVEEESNVIKVTEFISVAELARLMGVEPNQVIKKCLELGMLVSINQRLDMDTIIMVADEFGFEVEQEEMYGQEIIEELDQEEEDEGQLVERPPIVTVMGHVDHGKTSLLDYIRKTNVVAGEVGGITQHIGAYVVNVDSKKITFLDTPGHEAFTAMRARGAQVTDIVVLVVAADDRVMPQTIEAINHARAANVPIIVAINKIDKPNANPDLIRQQLADQGVLVEEWGGKYPCVEISAKTGQNVEQLLELILLQAEIMELKANPNRLAKGVIIESQLDKGRGPVATVLVQTGTLRIGDPVIAGTVFGKVRAMFDERGKPVEEAPPSTPVQVLGFDEVPQSGDILYAVKSERIAREISNKRKQIKREQEFRKAGHISLDEFSRMMREKSVKELKLIVKGDVVGSVEALSDALMKLSNEDVSVNVIHKGVGAITETDVLLASASDAVIIGFQVRPNSKAWEVANREKVDIRTYSIIYDAIEDVKKALEGLLEPEEKEEILGIAEVREVFRIPRVGNVAGCYVQSGRISRSDRIRVVRDGVMVYEGNVASLKRFKDDVREVQAGYECGVGIEGFNDIKVGDVLEAFQIVKVKRKLES
jgi:translation initiation factor IF-2